MSEWKWNLFLLCQDNVASDITFKAISGDWMDTVMCQSEKYLIALETDHTFTQVSQTLDYTILNIGWNIQQIIDYAILL